MLRNPARGAQVVSMGNEDMASRKKGFSANLLVWHIPASAISDLFGGKAFSHLFPKRGAISAEPTWRRGGSAVAPPRRDSFLVSARTPAEGSERRRRQSKSEGVTQLLHRSLQRERLFAAFTAELRAKLVAEMWKVEVRAGESVLRKGETGAHLYIVEKGRFAVLRHEGSFGDLATQPAEQVTQSAQMGAGDMFGQLAMLHDATRRATVTASEPSVVWLLDRQAFRSMVADDSQRQFEEKFTLLSGLRVLPSLLAPAAHHLSRASKSACPDEFSPKAIFLQGPTPRRLLFLFLFFFFFTVFPDGIPHWHSSPLTPPSPFLLPLPSPLLQLFESSPDAELVKLAEAMQAVAFEAGHSLGTEQKLEGLYIVKEGWVSLQTPGAHDTKTRRLGPGQFFGFEAMVNGRGLDPTQQAQALSKLTLTTITALGADKEGEEGEEEGPTICYTLARAVVEQTLCRPVVMRMARWEQSQQFKKAQSTPRSFAQRRDCKPARTAHAVKWPDGKGKEVYPRESLSVIGFLGIHFFPPQRLQLLLVNRLELSL